tara:strand:- start:32 stop:181 length:150 start_codon:yes stop_codon:yes gene_type:complete
MQVVPDPRYQRITLVAKAGGERMTLDTDLQFWSGAKTHRFGLYSSMRCY